METTLTINIPAPSARARGAGVGGGGGGGAEKEEKIIKTHPEKVTSYKDKFHKTREKYDKVTAAHEMYQKSLDVANAIVKNLQAENDLLLDAMFLADAGLYDRYFSTDPGSVSSPLDPYMFPESAFIPSLPPPPPPPPPSQLRYSSQHARYQPPPHSNPYPHPSHSSSVQAIAGPSHHPHRPHHRDHHHHHHQNLARNRRSDIGPSPPEELGFVGVPPSVSASASASNNANLSSSSSIPIAVDFDSKYDIPYKRTSRSSTAHHGHPSHLNGNSNGSGGDGSGSGPSGHGANGTSNARSVERPMDEDVDMKDELPEAVNGRS